MKKIIFISTISILLFTTVSVGYVDAVQHTTGTGNNSTTGTGNNPPSKQTSTQPSSKLQNPLKVNSVEEVILLAVDIAIYIGVAFAILAIIFVGFKFVMAQGNSDKLKEAKLWLLWIIIGLAVLISARVIVEIIKNTLIQAEVVNKNVFNKP